MADTVASIPILCIGDRQTNNAAAAALIICRVTVIFLAVALPQYHCSAQTITVVNQRSTNRPDSGLRDPHCAFAGTDMDQSRGFNNRNAVRQQCCHIRSAHTSKQLAVKSYSL